jgi:hypothetical protein
VTPKSFKVSPSDDPFLPSDISEDISLAHACVPLPRAFQIVIHDVLGRLNKSRNFATLCLLISVHVVAIIGPLGLGPAGMRSDATPPLSDCLSLGNGVEKRARKKNWKKYSNTSFRSRDLRVMSPARFRCAMLLDHIFFITLPNNSTLVLNSAIRIVTFCLEEQLCCRALIQAVGFVGTGRR